MIIKLFQNKSKEENGLMQERADYVFSDIVDYSLFSYPKDKIHELWMNRKDGKSTHIAFTHLDKAERSDTYVGILSAYVMDDRGHTIERIK
jgi:hypothetical protein